jgi:hypothetical protein
MSRHDVPAQFADPLFSADSSSGVIDATPVDINAYQASPLVVATELDVHDVERGRSPEEEDTRGQRAA